jgi:hypothetical protein
MGLSVMSIVDEYKVPLRDWAGRSLSGRAPGYQPNQLLGSNVYTYHTFHNNDGWERTERVPCDTYMVPAQYQNTKHDGMIAAMMHTLYPWLAKYKCDFYSMNFYDNHVEEFYVRTTKEHGPHGGHRSLYVPYAAFMAHDVAAIEKRNETYMREYTKGNETWNSMREDANVIAFLLEV